MRIIYKYFLENLYHRVIVVDNKRTIGLTGSPRGRVHITINFTANRSRTKTITAVILAFLDSVERKGTIAFSKQSIPGFGLQKGDPVNYSLSFLEGPEALYILTGLSIHVQKKKSYTNVGISRLSSTLIGRNIYTRTSCSGGCLLNLSDQHLIIPEKHFYV